MVKRILGTGKSNRKEPLTIEILKDIIDGADLSNTLQLRNICLYGLSYVAFFRSEEVTRIRRNHIRFCEGYMIIEVEKSKLISWLAKINRLVILLSGTIKRKIYGV